LYLSVGEADSIIVYYPCDKDSLLLSLESCIAGAAVYGLVAIGLERNLCNATAVSANGFKHLSLGSSVVLSCIAARLASLGLILEALFSIEFLLACSENEIVSAVLALQCDVLIHCVLPHFKIIDMFTQDGFCRHLCENNALIKLHGHIYRYEY
jgi:hypothetical protein